GARQAWPRVGAFALAAEARLAGDHRGRASAVPRGLADRLGGRAPRVVASPALAAHLSVPAEAVLGRGSSGRSGPVVPSAGAASTSPGVGPALARPFLPAPLPHPTRA